MSLIFKIHSNDEIFFHRYNKNGVILGDVSYYLNKFIHRKSSTLNQYVFDLHFSYHLMICRYFNTTFRCVSEIDKIFHIILLVLFTWNAIVHL